MEVRRAKPSDADAIAAVFIRSYESLTFLPRVRTHAERREYVRDVLLPQTTSARTAASRRPWPT